MVVAITTYKRYESLLRAVRSVIDQRIERLSISIYDNGGDPSAERRLRSDLDTDVPIEYTLNSHNIGSVRNIVKSFDPGKSSYFIYLADDDYLLPGFISRSIKLLEENATCEFTVSPAKFVDECNIYRSKERVSPKPRIHQPSIRVLRDIVRGRIPYKWSGCVFRERTLINPPRITEELGPFLDSHYILALCAKYRFIEANFHGAVYTVHSKSQSVSCRNFNREWPNWWSCASRMVEQDESILVHIRRNYRRLITPYFPRIVLSQILTLSRRLDANTIQDIVCEYMHVYGKISLVSILGTFVYYNVKAITWLRNHTRL